MTLGKRITADGLDAVAKGDTGHHIIVVESIMTNGLTGIGNNHWRVSLLVTIEGVRFDGLHLVRDIHVQQFVVLTEATVADECNAVGQHSLLQVTAVIECVFLQAGDVGRDGHLSDACPTEGVCPDFGNARRNVNMCQTQVRPVVLAHTPLADFLGSRRQRDTLKRGDVVKHGVAYHVILCLDGVAVSARRGCSVLCHIELMVGVATCHDTRILQVQHLDIREGNVQVFNIRTVQRAVHNQFQRMLCLVFTNLALQLSTSSGRRGIGGG